MKIKHVRLIIDMAMALVLPFIMAYGLVGEETHEILGSAVFALFIVHHILNRRWYGALTKGCYTPRRAFQTVLNALLTVLMLLQPVSGILMSKYVFTFIKLDGVAASSREIHLCLAYWSYILIGLHIGLHITAPLKKLKRKNSIAFAMVVCIIICASAYGVYAFIGRQFIDYMFMSIGFAFFDYSESLISFLADYFAIMALFAGLGALINEALILLSRSKRRGE